MLTAKQLADLRRDRSGPNRLQRAMDLAKVTQTDVANALGWDQPYISKIKRGAYGDAGLPLERTRALAEFFGCHIEDLFPRRVAA